MALTDEERAKIVEEEELRAKTRRDIERGGKPKEAAQGCLVLLVIIAAAFIALHWNDSPSPAAWYDGGTLQKATVREWRSGTPPDKLATAADFLTAVWNSGRLKPSIGRKLRTVDDLRPLAVKLVDFIDSATSKKHLTGKAEHALDDTKVSDIAAVGIVTMYGP